MGSWFVEPEVVRLPLSEGHWIDVKRDLTFGETQDMHAAMRRRFGAGEAPTFDYARVAPARMLAYLVGWSLVDPKGAPVAVSPAALDGLFTDRFIEMREALDAHVTRREQALADEKKTTRSGATASAPVLASVS